MHIDICMAVMAQGEVGVSYFPRPVREIISEDKLELVDRMYQPGDLLKRSVDDVQSGMVTRYVSLSLLAPLFRLHTSALCIRAFERMLTGTIVACAQCEREGPTGSCNQRGANPWVEDHGRDRDGGGCGHGGLRRLQRLGRSGTH